MCSVLWLCSVFKLGRFLSRVCQFSTHEYWESIEISTTCVLQTLFLAAKFLALFGTFLNPSIAILSESHFGAESLIWALHFAPTPSFQPFGPWVVVINPLTSVTASTGAYTLGQSSMDSQSWTNYQCWDSFELSDAHAGLPKQCMISI